MENEVNRTKVFYQIMGIAAIVALGGILALFSYLNSPKRHIVYDNDFNTVSTFLENADGQGTSLVLDCEQKKSHLTVYDSTINRVEFTAEGIDSVFVSHPVGLTQDYSGLVCQTEDGQFVVWVKFIIDPSKPADDKENSAIYMSRGQGVGLLLSPQKECPKE